ncbi:MAG: LptF/LptG family permease [Elusimicrobia bacterium]|nr:LptF/LptG family permease [Elusimicrobiota bacterium]
MGPRAAAVKIFSRYMALQFLKPFLYGLGLFALLIFLGDLFDKLPRLLKSPAPFGIILQYLWLEVPYWAVRVIPLATLLATLIAVTGFVASGEWAAVQAAGFETRAFLRPLLWMAAAVTLFSFVVQETVLPACYARSQSLWRDRIHPQWEWEKYPDVILTGGSGQFITSRNFFPKEGRMERPVMDYYADGRLVRQIDATEATWDAPAKRWVFRRGIEREFIGAGPPRERPFRALETDLDTPPLILVPRRKNPDEMSFRETLLYLRQVRFLGASPREAQTALYSKLSYPFANIILCALGLPIALRLRRSHRATTAGVALAVGLLYVWFMEMSKTLGVAGRLAPALAAWAPHFVFASAAIYLHRKTEI